MTVKAHPKHKTVRDPKYLKWVRTLMCPYCVRFGFFQDTKTEAHHVRRHKWGAGTSQKPHDLVAVPRCRVHHSAECENDVELEIIDLLIEYFGR